MVQYMVQYMVQHMLQLAIYVAIFVAIYGAVYGAFFHHYQGSIDFNTVNIHRTVGMYFLVSTGNKGDIE